MPCSINLIFVICKIKKPFVNLVIDKRLFLCYTLYIMENTQAIENATATFAQKNEILIHDSYTRNYPNLDKPTLDIQTAQKYFKVWRVRNNRRESIHAFVCKATGNIYKPAGTKAPAKTSRGNVLSPQNGLEAVYPDGSCIIYLR